MDSGPLTHCTEILQAVREEIGEEALDFAADLVEERRIGRRLWRSQEVIGVEAEQLNTGLHHPEPVLVDRPVQERLFVFEHHVPGRVVVL